MSSVQRWLIRNVNCDVNREIQATTLKNIYIYVTGFPYETNSISFSQSCQFLNGPHIKLGCIMASLVATIKKWKTEVLEDFKLS